MGTSEGCLSCPLRKPGVITRPYSLFSIENSKAMAPLRNSPILSTICPTWSWRNWEFCAQTCMVYSQVTRNPCLHPAPTTLIVWALGLECPSVAAKFCEEEWLRQRPKPCKSCRQFRKACENCACVCVCANGLSKETCRETLWQCSHMASTWSLQHHLGSSTPWTQVCTGSMWHNTESGNLWCAPASTLSHSKHKNELKNTLQPTNSKFNQPWHVWTHEPWDVCDPNHLKCMQISNQSQVAGSHHE